MKKRVFSTLSILLVALAALAEGRAKYEQKKALDLKRSEPRPAFEKKVFNNAPSGRYVSSSIGNGAFRPMRFDDDNQTAKKPDPSSPFVPAPSVNEDADDPAKKNKKFFGLF